MLKLTPNVCTYLCRWMQILRYIHMYLPTGQVAIVKKEYGRLHVRYLESICMFVCMYVCMYVCMCIEMVPYPCLKLYCSCVHRWENNIPKQEYVTYQITTKYTKRPINIPNCRKIFRMAMIYQHSPFQGPPKYTQISVLVCKYIYHRATLLSPKVIFKMYRLQNLPKTQKHSLLYSWVRVSLLTTLITYIHIIIYICIDMGQVF
jgi:hypothetical protein